MSHALVTIIFGYLTQHLSCLTFVPPIAWVLLRGWIHLAPFPSFLWPLSRTPNGRTILAPWYLKSGEPIVIQAPMSQCDKQGLVPRPGIRTCMVNIMQLTKAPFLLMFARIKVIGPVVEWVWTPFHGVIDTLNHTVCLLLTTYRMPSPTHGPMLT